MGLSIRGQFKLVDIIHVVQIILLHGITGICGYRLFQKAKIRSSRGDMIAMSASAKSLMFIFWMIGTERVSFLKRFYSLKTNMVLNTIEVVFWIAVVFLTSQSLVKRGCTGIACTLTYTVIALSCILLVLSIPVFLLSVKHWMMFRKTGIHPKEQERNIRGDESGYPMAYKG